ncbi:hypothetical protein Y032_0035g3065 [Ancylostoma ceylanicum]|uniref:Pericentriolar material 1 protein C-terminal domain-containing protein n=1 Tax=Ancylostoma ceylanicum TaxID=53326 RepID=A0A016UM83_9BILA|nr:hypothetical protein Y032_0035g3065 [Ancylostoma ceylanicum]
MSAEEAQTPSSDDNILIRHKHIAESIEMIRVKKDQLLRTLRGLSTSENPDRALMAKLIEAFDMMTAQENAFLGVLRNIVEIHDQATKDVAAEIENMENKDEKKDEKKEGDDSAKKEGEDNEEDENDEELIKETLRELEQVSLKALAAAELNEKLVETLQRHKKSRTSMLELRRNKTEELKSAATAAVAEVKKAKKEVSANRAEIQKKQKEAEELRKAALKAGIQVGADEEKHKAEVTAALTAIANDVERIPPIPVVEEPQAEEKEPEDPLEARRRQIRENVRKERERREHVNQVIKEKLLAMEARKERMKEIRRLLAENQAAASSILLETKKKIEAASSADEASRHESSDGVQSGSEAKESSGAKGAVADPGQEPAKQPGNPAVAEGEQCDEDEEQTRRDIEETFRSAEANLQNLTLLRQRLEEMQERGGELSQEDAELIGQLDEAAHDEEEEKNGEKQEDARKRAILTIKDSEMNELHDFSCLSFYAVLRRGLTLQPSLSSPQLQGTSSVVDVEEADDDDDDASGERLKHIERLLLDQTSMLSELLNKTQPSNSRPASVGVVHPDVLLDLLLGADAALLQALAASLLHLADGLPTPHLRRILAAICERKSSPVAAPETQDSRPTPAQVRLARQDEVEEGTAEGPVRKVSRKGLEQAIFSTMLAVHAVLDQSEVLDEDIQKRVREVVVASAAALFLNVPRSLIDAQLGPLVADVLASFADAVTAEVFDELSAEIVRVLGSELAFFRLINTLNCIPDPKPSAECP